MTTQIKDKVFFNDKKYVISGSSEKLQFHPMEYGITTSMMTSACRRGFWCEYKVDDGSLLLDRLVVQARDRKYPDIHGIKAVKKPFLYEKNGPFQYRDMNLPIDFTGKLLLGGNAIDSYCHSRGGERPWSYEELLELTFEEGNLLEVMDHSQTAAALRETLGPAFGTIGYIYGLIDKSEIDESLYKELKGKTWWL